MSDEAPSYDMPQVAAPLLPSSPSPPPAPPTSDERTYALLTHLSSFVFPMLGPLVMWLIKRDESRFIDHHGKEAVNFHITLLIVSIVLAFLTFLTCGLGAILTFPVILVLSVLDIVWTIQAALRANQGKLWRYPYTMRLIK